MSDFALFEQALQQYECEYENKESNDNYCDVSETYKCTHKDTVDINGSLTCLECGEEILKMIMHEKEWRNYGFDSRRVSDPNRIQMRKTDERSIFSDVENMRFSDHIIASANAIYKDVTKGKIYRGDPRKAIIFACIFHAYKLNGNPQAHDKLIKIFALTRKIGLKGLKYVILNSDKSSKIHTTYITPAHLVDGIMSQFEASKAQKQEVYDLYESVKNKSSKLNRARPQSTAAGLIYFWICKRGVDITLKEFARKAELSELTVDKIAREVASVLNRNKNNICPSTEAEQNEHMDMNPKHVPADRIQA